MSRCIELAKLGAGNVAPNPMVGAVLVHNNRILGEGYHQQYGEAHAEVNCINAIAEADQQFIEASTLYVSLEPCAHFGKTPPCADLIISKKIRTVVIGSRDPFEAVNGKGIEKLLAAGVQVTSGVLEEACMELNKRFFYFHRKRRPYVILKWAETADHYIGLGPGNERLMITNSFSNRLVHKWRSEEMSIMVGSKTASLDDPALTNRLWSGNSPVRIVTDRNLELPLSLQLFDGISPTIVFNSIKDDRDRAVEYVKIDFKDRIIPQVLDILYHRNLTSLMVEGGAKLLQSFIGEGYWNEARIITNTKLYAGNGVVAPVLRNARFENSSQAGDDLIRYCINQNQA
ncbi:MAG: bifunctional diaminohydroxyphosphoribosylaminopyrimidine deaminase/5-amino-6-(5-phosphoribosylamino)uracil reductase RibD [Chitinophagaceae bacterium]|nr:MAG: bifunctional diaminohydroxyphosphoribosylaminopyrimidine deaminase/5-amino-6-(5-phosphoribosylamino)uracil reductase RibD [Chitinophagaceae bacterium]